MVSRTTHFVRISSVTVFVVMGSMLLMPMIVVTTLIVMSIVLFIIFAILFLTEHICLIPGRLDEYLECRIQMDDHKEEGKTDESEDREEDRTDFHDREKCDNGWYDEGENEKYESHEYSPKIEEYHSIVEVECDPYMAYCHPSGCWECSDGSLILEYDKKLRIGEAHIQKKSEDEIGSHDPGNDPEVWLTKESQKQYIERDDSKRSKDRYDIVCFKKREKVAKSIEESLKSAVWFFTICLSIAVHHLYESSLCQRSNHNIEEK